MSHIVPVSLKASTTIAAYRIVALVTSTAQTVKVPAAASEVAIGITTDTVLDTAAAIPVAVAGIAKLYMNDTLPAGAFVAADSSGRGVPHVNVTAGSYVIGSALEACAATGTIIQVLIQPMFKSIP